MSKLETKTEHPHPHRDGVIKDFMHGREHAFSKFPLLFTLLATFGLVATNYGFQHMVEKIPLLANNPYIALVVGLAILIFTGKLYKKLG